MIRNFLRSFATTSSRTAVTTSVAASAALKLNAVPMIGVRLLATRSFATAATTSGGGKSTNRKTGAEDIVAAALQNLKKDEAAAPPDAAAALLTKEDEKKIIARCLATKLRISPIKLRWVANQVRGLSYNQALAQLQVSAKRKGSDMVRVALDSARFNAENQLGLDPEKLFISHISVVAGAKLKRVRRHARARTGVMHHRYARLLIQLQEKEAKIEKL